MDEDVVADLGVHDGRCQDRDVLSVRCRQDGAGRGVALGQSTPHLPVERSGVGDEASLGHNRVERLDHVAFDQVEVALGLDGVGDPVQPFGREVFVGNGGIVLVVHAPRALDEAVGVERSRGGHERDAAGVEQVGDDALHLRDRHRARQGEHDGATPIFEHLAQGVGTVHDLLGCAAVVLQLVHEVGDVVCRPVQALVEDEREERHNVGRVREHDVREVAVLDLPRLALPGDVHEDGIPHEGVQLVLDPLRVLPNDERAFLGLVRADELVGGVGAFEALPVGIVLQVAELSQQVVERHRRLPVVDEDGARPVAQPRGQGRGHFAEHPCPEGAQRHASDDVAHGATRPEVQGRERREPRENSLRSFRHGDLPI